MENCQTKRLPYGKFYTSQVQIRWIVQSGALNWLDKEDFYLNLEEKLVKAALSIEEETIDRGNK